MAKAVPTTDSSVRNLNDINARIASLSAGHESHQDQINRITQAVDRLVQVSTENYDRLTRNINDVHATLSASVNQVQSNLSAQITASTRPNTGALSIGVTLILAAVAGLFSYVNRDVNRLDSGVQSLAREYIASERDHESFKGSAGYRLNRSEQEIEDLQSFEHSTVDQIGRHDERIKALERGRDRHEAP